MQKSVSLIIALALLSGCATNPSTSPQKTNGFDVSPYVDTAKNKTIEGDYYTALTYWKLVATISPLDPEANHRIKTLKAFINRRAAYMTSEADYFMQQGMLKRAETLYLKTLALKPTDRHSLTQLRKLNKNQVNTLQVAKTQRLKQQKRSNDYTAEKDAENDYYFDLAKAALEASDWQKSITEINRFMEGNKNNKDALQLLATAEYNLALNWEQKGNYELAVAHTKNALEAGKQRLDIQHYHKKITNKAANAFYNEGIKIYRSDIKQAISWWEKSVAMDSSHARAKLRLKKARAMQKTLQKIQ